MSTNIDKLIKLNNLEARASRRKRIIILNPEEKKADSIQNFDDNIQYDETSWQAPEDVQLLVSQLSQNTQLSNEDKILIIYEKLCRDYVYDDNLISYIKKVEDDTFALPDWYGRAVDEDFLKNREQHNRRVCYEVSRYLAKALMDLFKDNEDYNITILWDKSLTHYFVALSCSDYSLTLDLDDFDNIKDLTRIKAGLTAEGIRILADKKGKFTVALDKFNEGRSKDAKTKIEHDIVYSNSTSNTQSSDTLEENDTITFLKNAIDILSKNYKVDSQGLYEYLKEMIDITLGPQARKKVWKEIKGANGKETRYIRCLILDIDGQKHLIDVDAALIRPFDVKEFDDPATDFIPYKDLQRNWREQYDGS